ncbi:MAG: ribonuclease P protein component [Alistipes sp.]|jgi:ribonuclease P protein component|nr:ribonuclease P protein component [Alistipes sp.]
MEKTYALPKAERLRSLGAVRRLFDEGTAGFVYPFRYMVITEQSTQPSVEVLFSVPKRNHKRANKRNLLRRRMKEAYRLNKSLLAAEDRGVVIDLALIYSSKELLPYKSINNAISRILREVAAHN